MTSILPQDAKLLDHPFFKSRMYKNQEFMNDKYYADALNHQAHNLPINCSEKSCNEPIAIDIYTVCHGFCVKCFLEKNASHYDENWNLKDSKIVFRQAATINNLLKKG